MYPRMNIDLNKLRHNADKLCALARAQGITDLAFVTKVFCADPEMVQVLQNTDCRYLADSRIENLSKYPESDKQRILLRIPMPSEADKAVRFSDISFHSEAVTLKKFSEAAKNQGKRHRIVLMVDLGDLREGIFFEETDKLLKLAETVENDPNLELFGMAFNLTCYGSVLPSNENLSRFISITQKVESQLGRTLPFISGGNSSSVPLLLLEASPFNFTNLRLGEALILGRETAYGNDIEGMYSDVVTLEAELVEVQEKPSYPIGDIGMNAFGEQAEYTDIGIRRRAIAAIGRQDMDCDGLIPIEPGITVVGASSDHLILDITESKKPLKVGDTVCFTMNYGGLLRGFTSSYVKHNYIKD